ncbi:Hypothetical predicted protein [Olea europaea subsp. europaea]|uniref:Uncharacterized protein n=1 Tax=Olea europaea subsp. europaea TaxID=158383 RepID=A0A8S0UCQ4_OLEEU|nr:Hypothetical predicted protein [Olea europaea subsp. europaea]
MGSCLSKKSTSSSSPGPILKQQEQIVSNAQSEKKKAEEEIVKKEVFVMKHRKSHEVERRSEEEKNEERKDTDVVELGKNSSPINEINNDLANGKGVTMATPVRTSSCTKEEVDAILIQCGRLSRSSSTGKVGLSGSGVSSENAGNLQRGRKYSGSKRSFDFDNENGSGGQNADGDNDGVMRGKEHRHRQSQRQSRTGGSASQGRRRTPSRERDQAAQQRSGSKERGSSGGGRRVSRSPGRRSESPITTSAGADSSATNSNNGSCRPGKMVSVPATVSSLAMDKSNNAAPGGGGGGSEPNSTTAIKKIQEKRTAVGDSAVGSRSAASPRNRSPARGNVRGSNDNSSQNQPVSLSRSNSRKAEQSPYRRNPLSEIDTNIVMEQTPLPAGVKSVDNILSQVHTEKANAENTRAEHKLSSKKIYHNLVNCKAKEQSQLIVEESKSQGVAGNFVLNKATSGPENLKPQTITRSRSFRLSQDLDNKPETPLDPTPCYTSLLLEDIQSFHQKNAPTSAFTLPPSVTKACSILEAVADLNSSTGSNLFGISSEEKMRNPTAEQFVRSDEKTRSETKREPIMESEVVANDDLIQPSFHKYVTVRRGMVPRDEDLEEQESSGSNSFVGSQEHWLSSSWEPNSVDSTDRSTSLMPRSRQSHQSPLYNQRHAISKLGH